MIGTPILSMRQVSKQYPGVMALDSISIDVYPGEILALAGENGAGKSTLIKIITGAIEPDKGEIFFNGNHFFKLTPQLSQRIGIAAIYQEFTLAPTLTVAENLFLGQKLNSGIIIDKKLLQSKANEILLRLHASMKPSTLVKNLSVAQMQLVEIGKALAKNARFIIMDEPTAPLTDDEVIVLGKIIKELKTSGITIIYISHRLDEIFDIADRVAVLRDGSLVSINNICNVNKENLIFDMVGRKLTETFPQRNLHYGRTMLEIKELSGQHNSPISFSVRQGEILGLGGLVGAGRTELTRLIFGADSKITGQIFIDGKEVEIKKPEDAVALGIGLVPEDRKNLGVLLRLSVNDNISLPILRKISNNGIVDLKKEETIVEKQIRELSIKTPSKRQKVINLSGGNQQKVALAKWLASDAKILILDEPTRGIDVGNKYEIYKLINQLAEKGMAIVVVSSDMQEIIGITDKLLILYEGKLMTELQKRNYSQEKILFYASGEKNQKGKCK